MFPTSALKHARNRGLKTSARIPAESWVPCLEFVEWEEIGKVPMNQLEMLINEEVKR